MSRFARSRRVYFVEEPEYRNVAGPALEMNREEATSLTVVTPVLPHGLTDSSSVVRSLLSVAFAEEGIADHIAWFYTPMALDVCPYAEPSTTVYDCMDELSLFRGAPRELIVREKELLRRCDLVFTGGVSLFEVKQKQHRSVHCFPSSVDFAHFLKARSLGDSVPLQASLPHPRLGYAGVIDERIDMELIDSMAAARPEWQFIMVGPTAKIDAAKLPQRPNLHWVGMRPYEDLPAYFAGWDVALMPFALNDSTRFISPTKTPEYLAAGLPVISTPIRDVVRTYGDTGLARIATDAEGFVAQAEAALEEGKGSERQVAADSYLGTLSWDRTWQQMNALIVEGVQKRRQFIQDIPAVLVSKGSAA